MLSYNVSFGESLKHILCYFESINCQVKNWSSLKMIRNEIKTEIILNFFPCVRVN
jgi:hypothetical protein